MKVFIEKEVSDDQFYCNGVHRERCESLCEETSSYCELFHTHLDLDPDDEPDEYGEFLVFRCDKCTEASKKAPLCNSTGKVCQCTCK